MSRRAWMLCAAAGCLFLAACGLSPEAQAAIEVIREMQAQGRVTDAQAEALIAALQAGATSNTVAVVVQTLGAVAIVVITGVPIAVKRVQKLRGPVATPNERVKRLAAKRGTTQA